MDAYVRRIFHPVSALVLLVVIVTGGAVGAEPAPELRGVPQELRTTWCPETPVVRVDAAEALTLDGKLDEEAWTKTTAFTHLERNDGQGALDLPTSVRFLRSGGELWIGVDAGLPAAKDGRDLAPTLAQERLEVWLDNAYTRHSMFQFFFQPMTGVVEIPGFTAAEVAAAVSLAVARRADGYSAEIRIRRDAFTALGEPHPSWVGINLARDCVGRWATLAGFVGQPQRPHAFWTLDLAGTSTPRAPTSAYAHPPFASDDPRAMAAALIAAWKTPPEPVDAAAAHMGMLIARLRTLLDADRVDPWGFPERIALVLWMALRQAEALPAGDDGWRAALRRLADARAPGDPVPATRWSEEVYRSDADDSWQPYALRRPDEVVAGRSYPLIIYLHGSGQGHAGDGAVFDRWAGPSRCFVAQACARRCDFYKSFAMRDVRDVIADVTRRFAIDPDRISLYGYSAGAFATLRLASQTPHEFAAIASLAGDLPPGEEDNLSAVPTLVVHGLNDPNVPIASGMAMNLFEWRRTGAPVTERLLPRSGHGTPLSGVEDWLLRHVRNPAPSAVVCRTARHDPRPGRAHWVAITSLVITDQQAAVSARIDGSVLKAVTANAAGCAFALSSLPGRIEAIEIDGQRLSAPTAACVALTHGADGWTVAGCERMPEADPADYAPGGVENLFRAGPILIVSGEGFADAAQRLASFSPDGANATIHWPVKAAADVVPADLAANNLILLGGADVNAVSAAVAKATWLLPLPANESAPAHALQAERTYVVPRHGEDEPTAIAGVTAFAAERYAFSLVTRNPFAPARRVWLLVAPDEALIARRSNLLRTWWQEGTPDLFVMERATGLIVAEWTMADGWRPGRIWR